MAIASEWSAVLRANAAGYVEVALANIAREFPSDVHHTMRTSDDFPRRPRERTPVFFGSFDWHSCVEMHWLLVRLLRRVPDVIPHDRIRIALDGQFTAEGLAAEARFIADPDNGRRERPYGWGWALLLAHELATWDDADGRRWTVHFAPLAAALARNFLAWLPKATYPIRYGVHGNSAFGLSLALPYARLQSGDGEGEGEGELLAAITAAARRWYAGDRDYPGGLEPSGADFLSPALVEAELMAQLLSPDTFVPWFDAYLPRLADGEPAALFTPAVVSDASDGQIAHLHGLNASRAWCWRRLADALPTGDARIERARDAERVHAAAALPHVIGDDYMVEHWLAAYATLLLT